MYLTFSGMLMFLSTSLYFSGIIIAIHCIFLGSQLQFTVSDKSQTIGIGRSLVGNSQTILTQLIP